MQKINAENVRDDTKVEDFWKMFNPFTPTWNTLGAHYEYSGTIFRQDISTKITFRKILLIIKYFVIKNIKHFRTNTGHIQATLGTFRKYFRVVHLGSEVQLLSQITAENKCWKRPRWRKNWRLLKNTQHFHTNLWHLGDTLGMFTNYF